MIRQKRRFIVHRHQATHLHYDLRLEIGGVLKSWAIPKDPPLGPNVKRLAIEVEDHPIEYLEFSGQIPEGTYGAGVIEIWDKGEYKLQQEKPHQLHLFFQGEKLKGRYLLIHTNGNNWLLLKQRN